MNGGTEFVFGKETWKGRARKEFGKQVEGRVFQCLQGLGRKDEWRNRVCVRQRDLERAIKERVWEAGRG